MLTDTGEKMNKKVISITAFILAFGLFAGVCDFAFGGTSRHYIKQQSELEKIINTTPLEIVANPQKYMNRTVKMQATFDKFSTLGLDYSKAMRPSVKYIGILIQRDDVVDHNIPLSEMKLFLKKDVAEKYIDLETGDKIEITAKVFSISLNDPWLDIKNLTVLKKVKKN